MVLVWNSAKTGYYCWKRELSVTAPGGWNRIICSLLGKLEDWMYLLHASLWFPLYHLVTISSSDKKFSLSSSLSLFSSIFCFIFNFVFFCSFSGLPEKYVLFLYFTKHSFWLSLHIWSLRFCYKLYMCLPNYPSISADFSYIFHRSITLVFLPWICLPNANLVIFVYGH